MGLGIKPLYEERRLEFLPDKTYCMKMIAEVIEYIPRNYVDAVVEISKTYGHEISDKARVRDIYEGRGVDRYIAFCINAYGKTRQK